MATFGAYEMAFEAVFVSDLQPSEHPSAADVDAAVTATLLRYGSCRIAEAVAAEFGDHPEAAVPRMVWARSLVMSTRHKAVA